MRGTLFLFLLSLSLVGISASAELKDVPPERLASELITLECNGHLDESELTAAKTKWTGKTVVFDTNVLINDPYAIFKYPGAKIVIPGTVIEELDDKKSDDRNGRVVRTFFRIYDELMTLATDQMKPIELPHNSQLIVDPWDHSHVLGKVAFDNKKNDNRIIATAKALTEDEIRRGEKKKKNKKDKKNSTESTASTGNVFLISDDRSVRIKAASLGVKALPFEYEWVQPANQVGQSLLEWELSEGDFEVFLREGRLPKPEGLKIAPNQFVMLKTASQEGSPDTVARYFYDRENPETSGLRSLVDISKLNLPFGYKNLEQHMALDVLLDPTVDLVIMEAKAGTGKSFVALLAALSLVSRPSKQGIYNSLMITRPLVDVGGSNRLGALPGDVTAKLEQDFNAFYDNLSLIWSKLKKGESHDNNEWMATANPDGPEYSRKQKDKIRNYQDRLKKKKEAEEKTKEFLQNAKFPPPAPVIERFKPSELKNLDLLPFMKMRGRSLHYTYLIADEFQNTSIHEAKTILTRAGIGTKFVLLGDTQQIDLPFLNERNNGLSVTIKLFTSDSLSEEQRSRVAFVRLIEGVRSPLSEMSVDLFSQPIPQ